MLDRGVPVLRETLVLWLLLGALGCATQESLPEAGAGPQAASAEALGKALTFHASFDTGTEADFARGDGRIYTASSYEEMAGAEAGLHDPSITLTTGEGRFGSALRFGKKNETALFYRAENNLPFSAANWSGTLSLWLRLTPDEDLEPGFCDPVQVTDKAYNDSAIWVDFPDADPRPFRLGVFGAFESWNPGDVPNDENPVFHDRLVVVNDPPFHGDRWTHVVITYSGLGSPAGGTASLYLDGELQGRTPTIPEPFEWEVSRGALRLGVNYLGLLDEVAVFGRPLTDHEVRVLHGLESGVRELHPDARESKSHFQSGEPRG